MTLKKYHVKGRKVIMEVGPRLCDLPAEAIQSQLFEEILKRFCHGLVKKNSTFLESFKKNSSAGPEKGYVGLILSTLRLLVEKRPDEIIKLIPESSEIFKEPRIFLSFIEELYNYWRNLERFLIYEEEAEKEIDHAFFIKINEDLRSLIITAYRNACDNLMGKQPIVYRQLPAGTNIGLLIKKIKWDCPQEYSFLLDVPFIRLSVLEPPVILYPRKNYRRGKFMRVDRPELAGMTLNAQEWLCYPAKVGTLMIHVFFHLDYISLGSSLINLFELASNEEISRRPDGILIFGLPQHVLGTEPTLFWEDEKNNQVVGVIAKSAEVDYFGYFKKMMLTLHNVIMMRRGSMPVHGAMARIALRDGKTANVVIVGDSGAGKSECLEAFRVLADKYIKNIDIIFDDMGSLWLSDQGKVTGFGTEIGAFVRLDDLQPGYAFGQIDRSIFMNPHRINARVVLPITAYQLVTGGLPVDIFLYANNYEDVDQDHPVIELFDSKERALPLFREGKRLSKGTTDERGLVGSYFANPFGPVQLQDEHEVLADKYFETMFETGVKVGQIRTRLGIQGFEQKGPESAAEQLFKFISEKL